MKTTSLFITTHEPSTGSHLVSMGLMSILKQKINKVAFFRPIIESESTKDESIDFMIEHFNIDMPYKKAYGLTIKEVEHKIATGKQHELFEEIIEHFKTLEREYDFVLCQGIPQSLFHVALDFDLNIEMAKHISSPIVNVVNGYNEDAKGVIEKLNIEAHAIKDEGCAHFASFANRLSEEVVKTLEAQKEQVLDVPLFCLPQIEDLALPTMREVKDALGSDLLLGEDKDLMRVVKHVSVGAMSAEHFLDRLDDSSLIIVPGDRFEIILTAIAANYSKSYPSIAGIVINGDFSLANSSMLKLLKGIKEFEDVPVLTCPKNSFETALLIDSIKPKITAKSHRKIALALGVFSKQVPMSAIEEAIDTTSASSITPVMFEYSLFETARANKKKIVLPESEDDRVLQAVEILLRRHVVDVILLGDKEKVLHRANALGLDIKEANIIDPKTSPLKEEFVNSFYELRKHKGLTLPVAKDTMEIPTYFATMMVHLGYADGMVSGAVNTTADTIRPALQIIKTKPGISVVSSVFFMCLDTKVLVYGDCAVNQHPNEDQLSQIATSSAETAKLFGIEPKVAMLSYSTGNSGSGEEVELVRNATNIVKEKNPELLVEGPIQYDAAIDMKVASKKLPGSKVAGQATVFIFPDLNTGNNTYKAVQRSSGALAIGPVLQGLKKPINDLSRGCLVEDIVNTVAITAIQAQGE